MLDFRKLLLALAVITLGFTTIASAQPYSCNATAVPTLVRSEGIAEQVGDILLNCSGVVPAAGIQANIRVRLNANITSNVLSAPILDGILLLDEASPAPGGPYRGTGGVPNAQLYQSTQISDTEVEFLGVVLAPPGSAGASTIRITNLRANVSALGTAATVYATVNITGSTTVPVNNNNLVVADSRRGVTASVSSATFKNCEAPTSFSVSFAEGFASAFRPVGSAATNTIPGGAYGNEWGYNPGTLVTGTSLISLASIGKADQGTRLMIRFASVPSGVTLTAPLQLTTSPGMVLQLVTGTDSSGAGGTVTSGTGSSTVTTMAVYQVTAAPLLSLASIETVTATISVSYTVPGPLGTATASGNFAPISTVFTANATAPEPRFIDTAVMATAFTIGPCRTILLFPYVSNQGGFDTGLALVNTSSDPLGTTTQAGTCTLNFYGNVTGTGPAPAAITSTSVAAGTAATLILSTGGTHGLTAVPGFAGYIFAICNFQYARGYAFISDLGATKLAHGYLALVVPDRTRVPQHSAFGAAANHGEQLGN